MTEKDLKAFSALMVKMGEVSAGEKRPSPEKIEMYFEGLNDIPIEVIKRAALLHFQKNKFFPAICELRPQVDEEAEAIISFDLLKEAIYNFYALEFGGASLVACECFLREENREDLISYLVPWSGEIANGNIGVVRAQFIRAYVANREVKEKRMVCSGESRPKQIGSVLEGIEAKLREQGYEIEGLEFRERKALAGIKDDRDVKIPTNDADGREK